MIKIRQNMRGREKMLKIYLDNCCYNRPFDVLTQERLRLESEAIVSIVKLAENNQIRILGSKFIEIEMNNNRNELKKMKSQNLYQIIHEDIPLTLEVEARSEEIMNSSNIRLFDSLHIAIAESAGVDILLTTDDKFEKMASNLDLKLRVMNPLKFILEMM